MVFPIPDNTKKIAISRFSTPKLAEQCIGSTRWLVGRIKLSTENIPFLFLLNIQSHQSIPSFFKINDGEIFFSNTFCIWITFECWAANHGKISHEIYQLIRLWLNKQIMPRHRSHRPLQASGSCQLQRTCLLHKPTLFLDKTLSSK